MARYKYRQESVSEALTYLNQAINDISDVNDKIQSAVNTMNSAQGGSLISYDPTTILGVKEQAEEQITAIIETIEQNVTAIEEFNTKPWYTKFAASIGMAAAKFSEGVLTGGEQIIDGFATITAAVVGIFDEEMKNKISDYIEIDHIGDEFAEAYESGKFSDIAKNSYFSQNSTVAQVFKGFGTATVYLSYQFVSPLAGTTVAAIAGVGSGTQQGLKEGLAFEDAALKGVERGAIQGALSFIQQGVGTLVNASPTQTAWYAATTSVMPSGVDYSSNMTAITNNTNDISSEIDTTITTASDYSK